MGESTAARASSTYEDLGLVPVMAAFDLLQRFFVAGLTAGAVKG
jgi:ABC-type maltose transport system permease subunit